MLIFGHYIGKKMDAQRQLVRQQTEARIAKTQKMIEEQRLFLKEQKHFAECLKVVINDFAKTQQNKTQKDNVDL